MKKYMVMAVFAMIAIMALGMLNTGAWFTDSATSATNSISSGKLSIEDGRLSTLTIGTIENLAPGDIIEEEVLIEIKNDGTIPLAWFGNLQFSGSEMLKDVLYIEYAKMEYSWIDDYYTPVGGYDEFIVDGVGSGLNPDWYDDLAAQSGYEKITFKVFDDNNGMGSTPYEFMGALLPNEYYKLTLKFGMVEGAGNEYQELGPINISLHVDATQIEAGALDALKPSFSNHLTFMNNQIDKQP